MASSLLNLSQGNPYQGPVAILWDIKNCDVPGDMRPEDVAVNIRMALEVHPMINGAVTTFSAYGDFSSLPRRVREGCQRTGVKLMDVPTGRKDGADKAILVDMFLFALDNRPPASIMLISGDVDFAQALHVLDQRGYAVIVVIPSGVAVSPALTTAGRFVWDWATVARGDGFLPSAMPLKAATPHVGTNEISDYLMRCHNSQKLNHPDEDAMVYRGIPSNYYNSTRDFMIMPRSAGGGPSPTSPTPSCFTSVASRSQPPPPCLKEATPDSSSSDHSNIVVQPEDLNELKGQLVKLLELWAGCLPLCQVSPQYQKMFGQVLTVSEYGASKLKALIEKFPDVMAIQGEGAKRSVYLRNSEADPAIKERKGKAK